MINIRALEVKDLIRVERIHHESSQFPMPNLNSKMYPVQKTIELDGNIVGSAFAQITSEISLSLDSKLTRFEKARVIKQLFNVLLNELRMMGIEDTHVFIVPESDVEYREFLKEHFKFVEAQGLPLYLRP